MNGGSKGAFLAAGKGAIFCSPGRAFRLHLHQDVLVFVEGGKLENWRTESYS